MSHFLTTTPASLTRRRFLTCAGAAAITAQARGLPELQRPRLAFAASVGPERELRVYAMQPGRWKLLHSLPSEAPVALAVHPDARTLYVLHEVGEHAGLPRGYIEAHRIEPASGQLTPLSHQPLSLSAIFPRHLAIAPDGKTLAVAIHGGGAYNLLSILDDGRIGRVSAIRKETGHGLTQHQASANPQAVLFDSIGRNIVAIDQGTDTVSIFAAQPHLPALTRYALPPGSGPRHLALHPNGRFIFVANALSGSLLTLIYDPRTGAVTCSAPQLHGSFCGPLTIHATSQTLFAAHQEGLIACTIDTESGTLHPAHHLHLTNLGDPLDIHNLISMRGSEALFAATSKGILRIEIDASTGRLSQTELVAPAARSIACA